jgi:hypothetical protein
LTFARFYDGVLLLAKNTKLLLLDDVSSFGWWIAQVFVLTKWLIGLFPLLLHKKTIESSEISEKLIRQGCIKYTSPKALTASSCKSYYYIITKSQDWLWNYIFTLGLDTQGSSFFVPLSHTYKLPKLLNRHTLALVPIITSLCA